MADPLLVAQRGDTRCHLLPALANRHGLITGATGTGKTITLQTLAENFSKIGVPVFMADVKGDLTGISQRGSLPEKVAKILAERGLPAPEPWMCPTTLWDVFGEQGHPVRTTVSDMGPLLLGRMLELNETQQGVLTLVFKIAGEGDTVPGHAGNGVPDDLLHHPGMHVGRDHRGRRVRPHAAGVGAGIGVEQALVVLAGGQGQHVLAIAQHDEAGFLALQ